MNVYKIEYTVQMVSQNLRVGHSAAVNQDAVQMIEHTPSPLSSVRLFGPFGICFVEDCWTPRREGTQSWHDHQF